MHALQGQQHYSQDEVDSTLVAQQHELLLTQQAFHAKQLQLEGGHELHQVFKYVLAAWVMVVSLLCCAMYYVYTAISTPSS